MTWTAGIDFTDTTLYSYEPVLSDIIKALNERCDAVGIDRIFTINFERTPGTLSTTYSGAVTSITVVGLTFNEGASLKSTGTLQLFEGANYDEVKYTAVSGTGNTRTFTVDATLTGSYTTSGGVWVQSIDPDNLYLYETRLLTATIDTTITTLIPLYIDHTQATVGEFVGKTSIPAWTEAAILTETGTGARILSEHLGILSTEWVEQVYKIINLLLWTSEDVERADVYSKLIGPESIWADVVSNWPVSWSPTAPEGYGIDIFAHFGYHLSETEWYGHIEAPDIVTVQTAVPVPITRSVDLYIYPKLAAYEDIPDPLNREFYDQGLGYTEDKLNLCLTKNLSTNLTNTFVLRDVGGDVPAEPPYLAEYGFMAAINTVGSYSGMIAVVRYDVAGGFSYV